MVAIQRLRAFGFALSLGAVLFAGSAYAVVSPPCPEGWQLGPQNPHPGVNARRARGTAPAACVGLTTNWHSGGSTITANNDSAVLELPAIFTACYPVQTPENCPANQLSSCTYITKISSGSRVLFERRTALSGVNSDFNRSSLYAFDSQPSSSQLCELIPEPPPGCDAEFVGSKIASFYDIGVGAPVQVCDTNSGCVAERLDNSGTCGPTQCGVYYKIFADVDCADVDPLPAPVPENSIAPAPQENCQTIGNAEYCIGSTPDGKNANCGYLNDQWVCVNATPKLGCQTGAGGVVCDAAAGAPPAPDSGIPGVKAAPDGQIKAETGQGNTVNTYNYYNSTTVAGSSRAPATGSPTGGGGGDSNGSGFTGDGDGSEEGEEGGTGTASGGESCASAPVCEGDPIQCAILAQQWRSRCLALSTVSEIQGQAGLTSGEVDGTVLNSTEAPVEFGQLSEAGPLGGGSCPPAITFSVMGQSISLDVWAGACDLAVMVSPLLLALSYFGAALLVYRGVIA